MAADFGMNCEPCRDGTVKPDIGRPVLILDMTILLDNLGKNLFTSC